MSHLFCLIKQFADRVCHIRLRIRICFLPFKAWKKVAIVPHLRNVKLKNIVSSNHIPEFVNTNLLRVLQHQTFQRVAGSKPVSIDVRVITATHRNIPEMIKAQTFREDFWYRLNVFPIEVPPLRYRKNEIPVLVQYLINRKLYGMNLPFKPHLAPGAMELPSWNHTSRSFNNKLYC